MSLNYDEATYIFRIIYLKWVWPLLRYSYMKN